MDNSLLQEQGKDRRPKIPPEVIVKNYLKQIN